MNRNEKQFPEGTRIKITEQYGVMDGNVPTEEYMNYHGREGVVLPYTDVNYPYVRIALDDPIEEWNSYMLMVAEELEVI